MSLIILSAVSEPYPPTNLSAKSINASAISVSWQAPSKPNGEIEYRLYIRLSNEEPGSNRPVYDGRALVHVVSGLQEFVEYTLTLVAFNVKYSWNSTVVLLNITTLPDSKFAARAGSFVLCFVSCAVSFSLEV